MIKRIINKILRLANINLQLEKIDNLEFFKNIENSSLLYSQLNQESREIISSFMPHSKSQLAQDLFAIAYCGSLEPKFFVEFGATDGITGSNTWLLEKKLGWQGILAEPAKYWHKSLKENRKCFIDTNCVGAKSGEAFDFLEVCENQGGSPTLSTLEKYSNNGDWASKIRKKNFIKYKVFTISLEDLLDKYNAPYEIDFLSIDTEGSEFEILNGFNFKKYKIKLICIEHNYVKKTRTLIREYLTQKGYRQVLKEISKYDDWYVLK